MKTVSSNKVLDVMKRLGFRFRDANGKSQRHHVPLVDAAGRRVDVWLDGGDRIHHGHLFPLSDRLEKLGVIDRRAFMQMLRAA